MGGAFERAGEILSGRATSIPGEIPAVLLMHANQLALNAEGGRQASGGVDDIFAVTSEPRMLGTYLSQLKTMALGGWKLDSSGAFYEKKLSGSQEAHAKYVISLIAQYGEPRVFVTDQDIIAERTQGDVLMGQQVESVILKMPKDKLEPVLQREGMMGGPGLSGAGGQ